MFQPIRIGRYTAQNRIAMAPMARARCSEDNVPTPMVAEYYAQRASAGLIVTEASSIAPLSRSRPHTSAIYLDPQQEGWRAVAGRVHESGGLIFQQLYHLGRKSDPSRLPDGERPVAPSEIAARGKIAARNGEIDFAVPRALETDEIPAVVGQFEAAAGRAFAAGMDGVEIHGANGYLIEQFLKDGSNRRTDSYGGSVENRARFLLEVVDAVIARFGADRVGVRLSPHFRVDGIGDSDIEQTYGHTVARLDRRGLAYLHLVEAAVPDTPQSPAPGTPSMLPLIRKLYSGPLIVNGGYSQASAERTLADGLADMVAFGTLYIGNPDLVQRYRSGAPLNVYDRSTSHNGGAAGYIDYPTLDASLAAHSV